MFDEKSKDRARQNAAGATIRMAEKAESLVGEEGILDDYKRAASEQGMEGVAANAAKEERGGFRGGLMDDTRAQTGGDASGAVNLVVALVVGGLMAAFLLPIAIDEVVAVDTSSWTNGAGALWDILPVMMVLAIFLFFVAVALRRSGRI